MAPSHGPCTIFRFNSKSLFLKIKNLFKICFCCSKLLKIHNAEETVEEKTVTLRLTAFRIRDKILKDTNLRGNNRRPWQPLQSFSSSAHIDWLKYTQKKRKIYLDGFKVLIATESFLWLSLFLQNLKDGKKRSENLLTRVNIYDQWKFKRLCLIRLVYFFLQVRYLFTNKVFGKSKR